MDKQEAIKILKEVHDTSALFSVRTALETVFPELKEGEDEKIRKTLIEYFNAYPKDYFGGLKKHYIIAWLEKQGGTSKEWTISDAATFKELSDFLENGTAKLQHDIIRYANWLKIQLAPKVKPKFNVGEWITKQGEQKSIEWSKEDERIYYSILADIRTKQDGSTSTLETYYNEQISWLKSLKQRIGG